MLKISRPCLAGTLLACLLLLVNSEAVFRADGTVNTGNHYVVQSGDDLWKIGVHYGLEPEDIAEANDIELSDPLQVGQNLHIPENTGNTYFVKQGESLWSIANKHGVSMNQLLKVNRGVNPEQLQVGQLLYLPETNKQNTKAIAPVSYDLFDWPVSGSITSKFGWRKGEFHGGIDIATNTGTDVVASRAGTVVLSGWNLGFGRTVKIDHGDGYCSIYAHNSKLLVKNGQHVSEGQLIAKSGNSGRSTGPHVHFEIRYKGVSQNPIGLLDNSTTVADIQ